MEAMELTMYKELVESHMLAVLKSLSAPKPLKEAMIYSVAAGGKRLRPALLFLVLEALGQPLEKGLATASALEMIHTYSLIHDDLPAMDNDSLRRGQPTNHIVFGEALAILAGDGLLTHAFGLIAADGAIDPQVRLQLVLELSKAAGPEGMVAGQVLDMEAEGQLIGLDSLKTIHKNKTGRLIEFAVKAGALIGGADQKTATSLLEYASHLGLAFQIKDDLLDVLGNASDLGKTPGKDAHNQKSTYVALLGLKEAKAMLKIEMDKAQSALLGLSSLNTKSLQGLAEVIGQRES